MKPYKQVVKVWIEGTVSQIFFTCLGFCFMIFRRKKVLKIQ